MCDESGFYGITFKIMYSIVSAFSGAYIGAAVATYFGLKGWKKALCMIDMISILGEKSSPKQAFLLPTPQTISDYLCKNAV